MRTEPLDPWLDGREWYVRGLVRKGDPRQSDWGFQAVFPKETVTLQRPLAIVEQEHSEDYIWVLSIQFVYPPPESTALPTYRLLLAGKVVSERNSNNLPEPTQPWPIYWLVGLKKSQNSLTKSPPKSEK